MAYVKDYIKRREGFFPSVSRMDSSREGVAEVREFLSQGYLSDLRIRADLFDFYLAPFLYHSLHETGLLDCLEEEERERLQREFEANAARATAIHREALALTRTLAEAGIPVLWLKELWMSHSVYEHPALRSLGDIDIIVPEDKYDHAVRTLVSHGFEPTPLEKVDGPGLHASQFRTASPVLGKEGHLIVDLHHQLLSTGDFQWFTGLLWRTARSSVESGVSFFEPAPEVGLMHVAIHLFNHALDPKHRFHALIDLAALRRKYGDTFDWKWLQGQTSHPFVAVTLYTLLRLAGPGFLDEGGRECLRSCESQVRQMRLSQRIGRIIALARSMPKQGQHDITLIMLGKKGSLLRALPLFVSRLFSPRRLERYQTLYGEKESSLRLIGFLRWLRTVPAMNWRFALTSYLVGGLSHDVNKLCLRDGRR